MAGRVNGERTGLPYGRVRVWAGRLLTGLIGMAFAGSAGMKVRGGPQTAEMLGHLGLPADVAGTLALLELACLAVYLVPATAALGAVLLTGYLGGAVFAHLRVGDPFFAPVVLGVLAWLGVYLREDRLWAVLPVRRRGRSAPPPADAARHP